MKSDDLTSKRLPAPEEQQLLTENTEESAIIETPAKPSHDTPVPPIEDTDIRETTGMMGGGVAAILALAAIVVGALLFFAARGSRGENYNRPLAVNTDRQEFVSADADGLSGVTTVSLAEVQAQAPGQNQAAAASATAAKAIPVIVYLFPTDGDIVPDNATLNRLASALVNNGKDVTIVAYTDETGNPAYNQKLSQRRAKSVSDYLVRHGVDASHISSRGAGPTHAFANDAADRCAVITVI